MRFRIYGEVEDSKTGQAIVGAGVKLYLNKEELQQGKSAKNGFYELIVEIDDSRIESGQQLLVSFEMEGYQKQEHRVLATEGAFNLNASLEAAPPPPKKPFNWLPVIIAGGVVLLLLVVGVILFLILRPKAPEILSFSADPNFIESGKSATLSWKTKKASSVEILIDQNMVSVELSGSKKVQPIKTSEYILIAKNDKGETRSPKTVEVKDVVPPELAITLSPSRPNPEEKVIFTTTVTDPGGISKIEILVNGTKVEECTGSPCKYIGGPYPLGSVSYEAYAWDKSANKGATGLKILTIEDNGESGQETLDQVNNPTWTGGATNIAPANKVSQTFVPSLPCLVGVEVALKTGNPGRGGDQLTLKILGAGGRELTSASAIIPDGFDGFWRFNLPGGGVRVTSGQPITILLQDTGKIVFWWKYNSGNSYPAGQSYFYGSPFRDNDFFFKTYGKSNCPSFSLTVAPDPANLTKGGSQRLTLGVLRQGGFTGAVNISFLNLPSGVSANPETQSISGNRATSTLSASTTAASGQFTSMVKGTSGSLTAQKDFRIKIATPPNPRINSVTPNAQQKGGTITITGTGFDSICSNNLVILSGVTTTPTGCSSTSLTAQVPQQAVYGATQLMVISEGRSSNSMAFTVIKPEEPDSKLPVVQRVAATSHPAIPAGLKTVCLKNPNTLESSSTCPVIKLNGYTYWPYSYIDNRVSMGIVAYDPDNKIVKQWEKRGARYVVNITIDTVAKSVTFLGQANRTVRMTWEELKDF